MYESTLICPPFLGSGPAKYSDTCSPSIVASFVKNGRSVLGSSLMTLMIMPQDIMNGQN